MIQPSTERKQPRTWRWLSRTLLVLGGTAAATGTAWLLSTAGASAATGELDLFAGPNQVLDTATVEAVANSGQADAGDLLADLTELADQFGLDRAGEAQLPPIADLPDHLREIAARMGFTVPPLELPIVDRPSTDQDQPGPLPAAPASDAAPESDSPHATVTSSAPAHGRVLPSVHANDADRRGPPVPDDRDLPLRTAPAAPGAPSSAGHDSPTYAEPPLADPSSSDVVARAERARDNRLPASPGNAPGTTPD